MDTNKDELMSILKLRDGNINLTRSECPTGWIELVKNLHEDLLKIDPDYRLDQVKEKFAGLRYYTSTYTKLSEDDFKKFYDRIREAEIESEKTCMDCGKPGKVHRPRSWAFVFCDDCIAKNFDEEVRLKRS